MCRACNNPCNRLLLSSLFFDSSIHSVVLAAGWPTSPSSLLCDGQGCCLTFSSVWQKWLWGHLFFLCKDGCRWNTYLRCKGKWGWLTMSLKRSVVWGPRERAAWVVGAAAVRDAQAKHTRNCAAFTWKGNASTRFCPTHSAPPVPHLGSFLYNP